MNQLCEANEVNRPRNRIAITINRIAITINRIAITTINR